jgi:hypothetical protein
MTDGNKEIVKRITVTIVQHIRMRSYPGMSPEQALAYERNLSIEEKVEGFTAALQYVPDEDLDYGENITIEDVQES